MTDPFEHIPEPPDLSGQVDILHQKPVFNGPYSSIYRGKLRESGDLIAIKVINTIKGSALHTMQRKLKRERKIWGALNHPNILPLWGFAEDTESFGSFGALISPWLQRGDASDFLEDNGESIGVDDRVDLWRDVLAGVNYLHSHNPLLVHGDLKPRNILIDDSGHAQICDFGLARVFLEAGSSGMTTTTHHTGTERYLAYELVAAADDATPTTASDIYAVGCIGLEFIFLQIPYAARQSNAGGKIFFDIKEGKPPAERPANIATELEDAWLQLEACWNTDPELRPSAEMLLTWLDSVIKSQTEEAPAENPESLATQVFGLDIGAEEPPRAGPKPLDYGNPLAVLNEKCALMKWRTPVWRTTSTGPSHSPRFEAIVIISNHLGNKEFGPGFGTTKQLAKRDAASVVLASGIL